MLWGRGQGSGACFAVVQLTRKASAKNRALIFMCVCVFDGLKMLFRDFFPGLCHF
jgi:hypothetical protein